MIKKKTGFLLIESLAAIMILALAITTISQVLSAWVLRVHHSSNAVLAQVFLTSTTADLLTKDEDDFDLENLEQTLQKNIPGNIKGEPELKLSKVEILPESQLFSYKKYLLPFSSELVVKKDGRQAVFKLVGFKIIDTPAREEDLISTSTKAVGSP